MQSPPLTYHLCDIESYFFFKQGFNGMSGSGLGKGLTSAFLEGMKESLSDKRTSCFL